MAREIDRKMTHYVKLNAKQEFKWRYMRAYYKILSTFFLKLYTGLFNKA